MFSDLTKALQPVGPEAQAVTVIRSRVTAVLPLLRVLQLRPTDTINLPKRTPEAATRLPGTIR